MQPRQPSNDPDITECDCKPTPKQDIPRRGRIFLADHVSLVSVTTVDRNRMFLDFDAACAACRCFDASQLLGDGQMLAWILMPDHVHWLIKMGKPEDLAKVVARLKSASARSVNRVLSRRGTLWSRAYHDHCLRSDENEREVARYIIGNAVRAGMAQRVGDYPFWNSVWV